MNTLSDKDLELAKKHGLIAESFPNYYEDEAIHRNKYIKEQLAALLAVREILAKYARSDIGEMYEAADIILAEINPVQETKL